MARISITEQVAMLNDPEKKIPWDKLAAWGFTKDLLLQLDADQQANGFLVKNFVNHGYSPVFKVRPDYKNNDVSITGDLQGCVRFYTYKDETRIDFQIARPQYRLDDDIYINDWTVLRADSKDPEIKAAHDNLVKYGYANCPVMVTDKRWTQDPEGEKQACVVSLDLSDDRHVGTNQARYVKSSYLKSVMTKKENTICGAKLTPQQVEYFVNGIEFEATGMKTKSGREFSCFIHFDPVIGMTNFNEGIANMEEKSKNQTQELSQTERQEVSEAKTQGRKVSR